jgi:hypothetical protein
MSTEPSENLEELGRRAVACKRWRWMPGMLGLSNQSSSRSIWIRIVDPPMDDASECWPDFSDPATLGCLLALVRQAWGNEASVSLNISSFWAVGGAKIQKGKSAGHIINLGIWKLTEAEALVAALEVAP